MSSGSVVAGALPLLTGIVIGLLTALATFSGRISVLETTTANHTETLRDIRSDLREISKKIDVSR